MASHLRALALAGKSRVLPYAAATLAYTPRLPRPISLLPHFSTAPAAEGGHNYDGEEKGRVAVDPEHGGQISPRMMGCGKSGSKEEPIGTCSTDGRSKDAEDGAQLSPPPPPTTTSGGEKSRGKKLLAAEEAAGLKILLSGGGSPDADAKKTGKAAYGLAVESSTMMGAAGVDVDVASGRRSPAEMGGDAAAGVDKDFEHLGDVPGVFKHHGDVFVRVDKDAGDAKHDGDVPGVSKHNNDMTACEDENAGDVKHHGDVSVRGHKDAGDTKHDGDVPAAAAGGAIHHGKSRSSDDQCAAAEAGAIGNDIAAYFRSLEKMVEREFHDTRVSFESSFQKHSKKMFQLREEMFEELWKQSQSMKHLRYQSGFLFFGVFCQLLGFAAIGFFYGISYAADYIEERIYALSSDERVAKLAKETLDGALSHVIEKMRNNLDMKEIFWNWWNSGSSEAPAEDSSSWWWWVWPSRWWGSKEEEEEEIEGTDGKK